MSKKKVSINLGPATAYAIAVKYGFKGTEEEWIRAVDSNRISSEKAAKRAEIAEQEIKEHETNIDTLIKEFVRGYNTGVEVFQQYSTEFAGVNTEVHANALSALESRKAAEQSAEEASTAATQINSHLEEASGLAETVAGYAQTVENNLAESKSSEEATREYADQAQKNAQSIKSSAEEAKGHAQQTKRDAEETTGNKNASKINRDEAEEYARQAKIYSERSEQQAEANGWVNMTIGEDGHLYETKAGLENLSFSLKENGHMEVQYGNN